ncbi:hypothetical protein THAOC_13019, partial [Thalassiosira oceanica]
PRAVFGLSSGRRRGLSCPAECHLHADGSIGSVRGGLRQPQTTIDASSVVNLSAAPMCSRSRRERFFLSDLSLSPSLTSPETEYRGFERPPPLGEGVGPGGGAARYAMMSSVETAATGFNDLDGRSLY